MSITAAGCPSAAERFTSRPSPSRCRRRPSAIVYSSTNSRILRVRTARSASAGLSISTSKCPEFARIAPSFISSMCSRRITLVSPVTVTNMSPMRAASRIGITR